MPLVRAWLTPCKGPCAWLTLCVCVAHNPPELRTFNSPHAPHAPSPHPHTCPHPHSQVTWKSVRHTLSPPPPPTHTLGPALVTHHHPL